MYEAKTTMSRLARISVVTLSVVVFLYVGLGYVLGKTTDDKSYRSLSVYGEVLQHIQEDYVDEPNMAVVTVGRHAWTSGIARSPVRLFEPARVCRLSRPDEECRSTAKRA